MTILVRLERGKFLSRQYTGTTFHPKKYDLNPFRFLYVSFCMLVTGRKLEISSGRLAKFADGSAVVQVDTHTTSVKKQSCSVVGCTQSLLAICTFYFNNTN